MTELLVGGQVLALKHVDVNWNQELRNFTMILSKYAVFYVYYMLYFIIYFLIVTHIHESSGRAVKRM